MTLNIDVFGKIHPNQKIAPKTRIVFICMYVCKVFCLEAGLSLDMHYQDSTYLSLLDNNIITRKTWKGMNQTKMEGGGETEQRLPKTDDSRRLVRR